MTSSMLWKIHLLRLNFATSVSGFLKPNFSILVYVVKRIISIQLGILMKLQKVTVF